MNNLYYSQANINDNTTLWNNDSDTLLQYVASAYNEYNNEYKTTLENEIK